MSFTAATANVRKDLQGARLRAAITEAAVADVLCVQEAETVAHVAVLASQPGYTAYFPDGAEAGKTARNACPILWHTLRFDLLDSGSVRLGKGIAKVQPDRPCNWVLLRDRRTGGTVAALSAHTVSGITKSLLRKFRQWFGRNRLQESDHELAAIATLTRTLKARADVVVGGGDLNRARKIPARTVGADRVVYASGPTHGRHWFDVLWLCGATASEAGRIATASDHKVLVATIDPDTTPPAPPPKEQPVTTTAAKVVSIAAGEVGYHEGRSGGHWNNAEKYAADVPGLAWANFQPWCDTFVCWVYWRAGGIDLVPYVSASCNLSAAGWKKAGRWSEYPAVGAQVFYGSAGNLVHTGIVVGFDANSITTVEGNTNTNGSAEGDGVYRKTRARRDPYVVGYGHPKFAAGIASAAPDHPAPKPTPKPTPTPPAKPVPVTRGPKVDAALTALEGAGGGSKHRRALLGEVRSKLRSLATWPKTGK